MTTTAIAKLDQAAREVPGSTIEAATNLLRASDTPTRAAFVARAMNALARLVPAVSDQALGDAAGAATDYDVLLRMLEQPAALTRDRPDDPLAAARLRGLRASQELLAAEGGVLSVAQVASLLCLTRQAVDKRRRTGRLLGLPVGRRGYAYPAWQFAGGTVLPGLEATLAALRHHDPWMQLAFMLNANTWLAAASPLAELRQHRIEPVLAAAERYGEQGGA